MKQQKKHKSFVRMACITLAAILFLIWVGAMVRATDAGMGCPDWPTCFGQWVPPTNVSQLPLNYKEIYADHGYANNDFDPIKTWTEYLNRLTGTTIGLLIFITLLLAFLIRKQKPFVFKMTLAAFIAVGVNGWLGSIVVKTNLHPAVITTHMLLAFAAIGTLMVALCDAMPERFVIREPSNNLRSLAFLAVFMTVIQVALGAQVREGVDAIAAVSEDFYSRDGWVEQLGPVLNWHRLFAVLVFLINAILFWRLTKTPEMSVFMRRVTITLLLVLLCIVALGGVMVLFSIPPLAQPLHLFCVALLFSVQIITLYSLRAPDKW